MTDFMHYMDEMYKMKELLSGLVGLFIRIFQPQNYWTDFDKNFYLLSRKEVVG
jgi:hypothetical protein